MGEGRRVVRPYFEEDGIVIYHGDCREVDAWQAAEVLVTDPPYGIAHSSNKSGAPLRGEQIANDLSTEVRDEVVNAWGDRPAIVFGTCKAPPLTATTRAVLVWDKGGHVGMGDLSLPWKQNWEHVYICGQGFAGRRNSGVLRYNAIAPWAGELTHPHEKPVELLRDLIGKCPPGLIADPFMGSGTTLRAAKDLGRRAVGVEVEERYCEIAAKRLAQGVLDFGAAS